MIPRYGSVHKKMTTYHFPEAGLLIDKEDGAILGLPNWVAKRGKK
jgi:hypothetical protein